MDRAINASSSCETAVRGIHNRIDLLPRNVAEGQFNAALIDSPEHGSFPWFANGFARANNPASPKAHQPHFELSIVR
jgi:hypothetical protein